MSTRGFYIEVPRPTPEEWGVCRGIDHFGEYDSREAFLRIGLHSTRWRPGGSMLLQADTGFRSIRVTDRKRTRFIITNSPKCADAEPDDTWCRENLPRLFYYLQRLIDVVVANPDGFNDYVAHNLPYQQRIGRIAQKNLTALCRISKLRWKIGKRPSRHWRDSVHGRSVPLFGNHDHTKVLHLFPHCQ